MAFSVSSTVKNAVYYRRDGETLYKEHPETNGGQVVLTAQNGVTQADVQSELEAIHSALAGQSKISVVADITARDALTGLKVGDIVWAIDASSDSTVDAGAAAYIVASMSGSTPTFAKVSEVESMDVASVVHVATTPSSMPAGLIDGGLVVVDA